MTTFKAPPNSPNASPQPSNQPQTHPPPVDPAAATPQLIEPSKKIQTINRIFHLTPKDGSPRPPRRPFAIRDSQLRNMHSQTLEELDGLFPTLDNLDQLRDSTAPSKHIRFADPPAELNELRELLTTMRGAKRRMEEFSSARENGAQDKICKMAKMVGVLKH